jgi:hypothetical protein
MAPLLADYEPKIAAGVASSLVAESDEHEVLVVSVEADHLADASAGDAHMIATRDQARFRRRLIAWQVQTVSHVAFSLDMK